MSIGRGLGALLGPNTGRKKYTYATGGNAEDHKVWSVPVSEISRGKGQPRKYFSAKELNELADSIKEHGILQPLLVVELADGGYELVAGERRLRAAKIANLATVPVLVKEFKEGQKLEVALIENIQREDLNPIEEAFAYKRLVEEFGMKHEEIAKKVGKARPTVSNMVRLLDLSDQAKSALIEGKISYAKARALLMADPGKEREEMLESMLGSKISTREAEKEGARRSSKPSRRDPNLAHFEDKLRNHLNTKVEITRKGEKGKISISYFSKEEFNELVKKIVGVD